MGSPERIKKLEEQIARKRAELIRQKGTLSERQKKARARRVFQIGTLAEIAGLLEADPGFILGQLLSAADISPQTDRWKALKQKGDAVLKEHELLKKSQKKEA